MRDGVQARIRPLEQTAERFTGKPGPGWARPARPVKSDGGRDSPAYPYLNSVPERTLAASQTRSPLGTMTSTVTNTDHRVSDVIFHITLRQMWKRENPASAMCVQSVNVQCVCNSH
jgi:hypothetical protein